MIEIVNGYFCRNCAEAADAKRGKDPHAKPGELAHDKNKDHKISSFADQPATVLDGALKGLVSANPVTAATASDTSLHTSAGPRQSVVNILL